MNAMIFVLPDIGPALKLTRELVDRPLSTFVNPLEVDVPNSLASFLCGVAYGAAAFDNTHIAGDVEEIKKMAPQFICSVIEWLKKAENSAFVLGGEQELLDEYPDELAALLPVPRWQEALRRRIRWIENNRDLPDLIRAWRTAIICPEKEKDSELFNRIGGSELTSAVRTYNDAFAVQGRGRNQILTRSIIELRRILGVSDADVIVRQLVWPFLQLAFYRSGRKVDAAEVRIPTFPPVLAQLRNAMRALAAKCRGEANRNWPIVSAGFAMISTREEDALLDSEIGAIALVDERQIGSPSPDDDHDQHHEKLVRR